MKAEIYSFQTWIRGTEPLILKKVYNDILLECEFNIFDFQEHFFNPCGYTAIWLLGESHFAIHTFPEHEKTYLELSSCNKNKYNKFKKIVFSKEIVEENSNEIKESIL